MSFELEPNGETHWQVHSLRLTCWTSAQMVGVPGVVQESGELNYQDDQIPLKSSQRFTHFSLQHLRLDSESEASHPQQDGPVAFTSEMARLTAFSRVCVDFPKASLFCFWSQFLEPSHPSQLSVGDWCRGISSSGPMLPLTHCLFKEV